MAVSIDIEKDFKGFSLRVKFDSTCATMGILGASGSGKSITLRCIAGIETPDRGRIVVNGRTIFDSDQKINLNTADVSQLTTLTGVGESKALAIIAYREENGPFTSIEDIMNVPGIKEGTYEKIKDKIAIE